MNCDLAALKNALFNDIDAFVDLSVERYGAKLGGEKAMSAGVVRWPPTKVLMAIQDSLAFDEGLQAAKALIDECVHEWTQDAASKSRR